MSSADRPVASKPDAKTVAQAKAVNAYWAPYGLDPEAKPTLVNGHWTVRSNMVGTGWPAKRLDTPDDPPQRDGQGHGPVDATRKGWPRTLSLAGDSRARVHQHSSSPSLQSNDCSKGDADPCARGTASCRTG